MGDEVTQRKYRVMRGGAWYNRPVFCRSPRRDFMPPGPVGKPVPVGWVLEAVEMQARDLPEAGPKMG